MKEFIHLIKNTIRLNLFIHTISFMVLLLFAMTFLESCTKKTSFQVSTIVPAAEGWVKVEQDKNNNYQIELNVQRLADPQRLTPPRNIYAVWIDTEQNGQQNIGQLRPTDGLFSNSVNSSLKTLTPYKPISVFVTAEDNINIKYPDPQIVLKTDTLYHLWK
ncbi:MAG TPA: hypothetical protein VFG54_19880 [Prolixibacteraceae bacterium]|nr:hypothetical protein [Prolixibacteraceae bacterium]